MSKNPDHLIYPGSDQYTAEELAACGTTELDLGDEPIIKVDDTAYVLFEVPDLGRQQDFLEDFGLKLSSKTDDAIYLRGFGPSPFVYMAQKGAQSRFLGAGFVVKTSAELEKLAAETGQCIEAVEGPGGGKRVRLHDPDGFIVDVVHGRELVEPLPTRREVLSVNTPDNKQRVNKGQRPALEPAAVERFGHYVIMVSDFQASWQWYRRHLGVLPSDVLCIGDGSPVMAFTRLDRGLEPADHHTVVIGQGTEPACLHSAYETLDQDSVGQGQQYLRMKGWDHFWGIGRHILGSQVFDYWLDPFGQEVEHYADGDVFDNTYPAHYHPLDRGGLWAWGNDVPDSMRPKMTLKETLQIIKGVLGKKLDMKILGGMKRAMDRHPRPWMK